MTNAHRRLLMRWALGVFLMISKGAIISTMFVMLFGGLMRNTAVKFSEDVVPLGDLKVNPGKIVRRIDETGRPVLLTSHGRGVAVVQALGAYEAAQEERDFMRAVVAGLADVEAGRVMSLDDAMRSLGID